MLNALSDFIYNNPISGGFIIVVVTLSSMSLVCMILAPILGVHFTKKLEKDYEDENE